VVVRMMLFAPEFGDLLLCFCADSFADCEKPDDACHSDQKSRVTVRRRAQRVGGEDF